MVYRHDSNGSEQVSRSLQDRRILAPLLPPLPSFVLRRTSRFRFIRGVCLIIPAGSTLVKASTDSLESGLHAMLWFCHLDSKVFSRL
jgi:hypothetical protein